MDRDCNKCVWHTDGNCKKWDCEYKTVEDIRAEIEEEAESRMCRILDDEKKLSYEQGRADIVKEYKEWLKNDMSCDGASECDGMCIDCFLKEQRNDSEYL